MGRRDVQRRGVPGVRLGRVPGRRRGRSRHLRGRDRALRAGGRRRQGDQPGDREGADRGRQALGWAVRGDSCYKDGRVANANMPNCIVPTFADAPELETIIVEVPYPYGPSGAKGVGEIPMDGPAAAVANAVEDALGCPFDELPISPEHVAAARPRWDVEGVS